MKPRPRILILGAGVSGLALAYRLRELSERDGVPLEVDVLEEQPRAGGTIETEHRDGFILEKGPDSFLSEKPWAINLCLRLGLAGEILETCRQHRRSFVLHKGRLLPVPEGFQLLAPIRVRSFLASPLFSWRGKLRMMAEPLVPRRKEKADESVASFVRRRFGREALERAAQPLVAGIYTGDPEKLSASSVLGRFTDMERARGSVFFALRERMKQQKSSSTLGSGPRYGLFLSLKPGMRSLVDRLLAGLEGFASVRTGVRVGKLSKDTASRLWSVEVEGEPVPRRYDTVCFAVPASRAAALLAGEVPELSARLSRVRYESVATVNLAFEAKDISHPLDGFGFVVPRTEPSRLVACSFTHRKFPGRAPDGHALLRAFVGGAFGGDAYRMDDADLLEGVREDLSRLLGIRKRPIWSALKRYPDAMTQYEVGHSELSDHVRRHCALHPGLYLAGAYRRGVGIPDCIAEAEAQAEAAFARCAAVAGEEF